MSLALKILIVVSSHGSLGTTGENTGYWLSEVTHPYTVLAEQGYAIDIASPKGGKAPMDPKSMTLDDPVNKAFWGNPELRGKLEQTKTLASVDPKAYKVILFAGGHGAMWDFTEDKQVEAAARTIYEAGGVVAAVCHGPAALINIKLSNQKYLIAGKRLTGFTNAEEDAVKLTKVVPFALETKLKERGAKYESGANWADFVITDERLVTGQNPASAEGVGKAVVRLLRAGKS